MSLIFYIFSACDLYLACFQHNVTPATYSAFNSFVRNFKRKYFYYSIHHLKCSLYFDCFFVQTFNRYVYYLHQFCPKFKFHCFIHHSDGDLYLSCFFIPNLRKIHPVPSPVLPKILRRKMFITPYIIQIVIFISLVSSAKHRQLNPLPSTGLSEILGRNHKITSYIIQNVIFVLHVFSNMYVCVCARALAFSFYY